MGRDNHSPDDDDQWDTDGTNGLTLTINSPDLLTKNTASTFFTMARLNVVRGWFLVYRSRVASKVTHEKAYALKNFPKTGVYPD